MDQFENVTLKHVSRDQNAAADTLVNQALNAGRDIEGDVEDPTSNITDKPIRAAVNVNDIIQFRQTSPYREPICRDKDFLTELICLSPNQSCPIKTTGSKTTLTVIRGRGNLKTDSEKTPLKTGAYLLLGPTPSLEITADADEKLVLIVTQIS